MEILDFIWRSIPMLLQLYADFFLKADVERTMIELETEHNVPITRTYDFIVGELIVKSYKLSLTIESRRVILKVVHF